MPLGADAWQVSNSILVCWSRNVFKHILIATDGSELGEKATAQGLGLASELKAQVLAVVVAEPWMTSGGHLPPPSVIETYEKAAAENADRITSRVVEAAKKNDVACSALHLWGKHPAEGILEAATKNGCDLIVMASHGRRGLERILLGSVATEVLVRSTISVLICR
jgi:nucleotide-binding universal stress UspA family protein